ncbi:L,D-transpeptidase family protein [Altererythrobacter lutimaris]|uniref:L,D-transpeptidase family protein n=1 Tax=Altererythrobacter lutimaris TaxID=2743979 RepID=A0A850HEN3_9SPHN|nr:L,D-transpeptidase family protein [Altererythrobacter lutimaris]NVE96005.1 L,D-transpeptidase family protein [Altererythrobacter lutimaris]
MLMSALLAAAPAHAAPAWTSAEAENLLRWIERTPEEGLTLPAKTTRDLRNAIDAGDADRLDAMADEAALLLMRAWRGRCCGPRRPSWWHIHGGMSDEELQSGLETALGAGFLDLYLRSIRPSHPHYSRLIEALAEEQDADRQAVLKANLARWRLLPARMGEQYLLVNIAAQELTLWQDNEIEGRWKVIVGKPITRTPVFTTQVSGVVLNPWWEIPSSIAAEGIARFVQRSPSAARARGYIYQNGRYRQMPGDNNALGRMKLVMPNPYSVFLHDTSNRELFAEDKRFFSHGCIRVDQALSFAATLLAPDGWDLARVEAEVAGERTQTIPMSETLPLYVTYFTAEPSASGEIRFFEDVYRRDPVAISTSSGSAQNYLASMYGSELFAQNSTRALEGGGTCAD